VFGHWNDIPLRQYCRGAPGSVAESGENENAHALQAGVHRGPDVYNTSYTLCSHCGRDFGMTCEEACCEEPVSVIDRRHLNGYDDIAVFERLLGRSAQGDGFSRSPPTLVTTSRLTRRSSLCDALGPEGSEERSESTSERGDRTPGRSYGEVYHCVLLVSATPFTAFRY
jgi:hypothetical protein